MVIAHYLLVLGFLASVAVGGDDKTRRLEAGADAVVDKLVAQVGAAAVQPEGLTTERLSAAVGQAIQAASGKLKELKTLDPTGDRTATLIADRLVAREEGVLKMSGMAAADVNNIKTAVRQSVKTYQASH